MTLRVTKHAVERFRERIPELSHLTTQMIRQMISLAPVAGKELDDFTNSDSVVYCCDGCYLPGVVFYVMVPGDTNSAVTVLTAQQYHELRRWHKGQGDNRRKLARDWKDKRAKASSHKRGKRGKRLKAWKLRHEP